MLLLFIVVRACVRACVRVRVCVCVLLLNPLGLLYNARQEVIGIGNNIRKKEIFVSLSFLCYSLLLLPITWHCAKAFTVVRYCFFFILFYFISNVDK